MITYTTCASCRGILELPRQDAPAHHPHCPPPPPDKYEEGLALFAKMTGWITTNTPNDAQIAKYDRMRLWLQAEEDKPPRLKDAALAYIAWGWHVFPLWPKDKTPYIDHWDQAASTELGQIHEWWDQWPDANIGLPTGRMFDVLDFDNLETLQRLEADGRLASFEKRGIHGVVQTRRGAPHWYLEPSGQGNKADVWGKVGYPGVDYRGAGGYVVAPPSWLGPGQRWRWLVKPSPTIRSA